jgi:MATE family multidrug resistance protein
VYLNRARIAIFLVQIPISTLLMFSKPILLAIGIKDDTASFAQIYINSMIPGLFALGQSDAIRGFLNYLQKSKIPLVVMTITCTLHLVWCYIFVTIMGLEIQGAALATTMTYIMNLILMSTFASY